MQRHKTHHFAKTQESYQEEIGAYMSTPVISIDSDARILDVTQQMETQNVGSTLVVEDGEYVGIVTERDITRKVIAKHLNPQTASVSAIMEQPILTLEGSEAITSANQFMAEHKIRHLAVTDGGKIVGMLSVKDLVSFFSNPRLRR